MTVKPPSMAQSDVHPTGDQEVMGSIPTSSGNILLLRLIMKYFLRSFSSFTDSRRAVVSFWRKNVHKYWLTAWRTKPAQEKVWLGNLTTIDITLIG